MRFKLLARVTVPGLRIFPFLVALLPDPASVHEGYLLPSHCQAITLEGYTSQTYIDTLVLNALYVLEEAASIGGLESRQRAAIDHAKRVVAQLRRMAPSDPNRKYILFKAGELESQIFLEENGLLREDAQRKQKEVLRLIDVFNAEIGKRRPNFIELQRIHAQMSLLNPSKGNELIYPMTDRQRNISKEMVMVMDRALQKGDIDAVRGDLDYCDDMQGRLAVSPQKLRTFRAAVQSRMSLDEERLFISTNGRLADSLFFVGMLGPAQDTLHKVRKRLDGIKASCPPADWSRWDAKANALSQSIAAREDSLIEAGLAILATEGIYAAVDHRDLLKRNGVTPAKISRIDREILNRATSQQRTGDERIGRELNQLAVAAESEALQVGDLTLAAKRKAQQRADSLARANMSKRERRRAEKQKKLEEEKRELDRLQEAANSDVVDIYALVEQGRVTVAYARFKKSRKRLKKYLCPEAYDLLLSTLDQSYAYARQAARE